ncbi:MAG: acetyl-CoA carboxylase biotin carboxyl carrier protein subunit [Chloroflexi bacterium]|nr:acetyl-CoA carboxylase biotin carboxyl carrier protein subunit [Chloroflexota bacterium]
MPHDHRPPGPAREPRSPEERAADHAEIERLADDLVPALIAKLSASGLGEIEVGEDAWTVRVRRPGDGATSRSRRDSDRASRSQPGHAGHGHTPGGFEGHRSARETRTAPPGAAALSTNGSSPAAVRETPSMPAGGHGAEASSADHRVVATSPAVGVFQPRSDVTPGTRVRNGDKLGAVDMLGVPQEVVAPVDGILGASLVEAGQAVEYGQELIVIELSGRSAERGDA